MSGEGNTARIPLPFHKAPAIRPLSLMMLLYLIFLSLRDPSVKVISQVQEVLLQVTIRTHHSGRQLHTNTHMHAYGVLHTHIHTQDSFQRSLLFLLLPFPFSGLPTFPECPGCAVKEPCLLCAPGSPNPALFCPDSWFSLSLFRSLSPSLALLLCLSLIFTVRVLALTRRLFSQFSPPLTAKCGPCECKHAEGRDIS